MKKRSRKLISFLMVFALLGGLLFGVNTVKAQEPLSMERAYARQDTITKNLVYDGVKIGTINCIVAFTYDLPTGQPMINSKSYTIGSIRSGYSVGNITISVKNGNPAIVTYSYTSYKNNANPQRHNIYLSFNNNGIVN